MDLQRTFEAAVAHHRAGRIREAESLYRQILQSNPSHADSLQMLSLAAHQAGRDQQALELITRAIAIQPHAAPYHCNLGILLGSQKRWDEAIASFRQAIRLQPGMPEAHHNLGNALRNAGRIDEAIAAYREALTRRSNWPEAHFDLAEVLRQKGQFDEAIEEYRRGLRERPNHASALNNLGTALKDVGLLDEAMECFSRSESIAPNAAVASNLLYVPHFHPKYDAKMLLAAHRAWNARYAVPLAIHIRPHQNDPSPDRRLRIGYVSANFRKLPVGLLILPLLKNHDRANFEVYCYSDTPAKDSVTEKVRAEAACWRDMAALSDEQPAEQVRSDQIDILVDLTLHMGWNRLLTFARKPAPVQVTYLGYASTTGLDTMDYRISDRFLDPPAAGGQPTRIDDAYTEQTICLPGPYWCFDPLNDNLPVSSSPAASRGYVTFGCLNNFCKVNEPLLELWAQIMLSSANSRLLLFAPRGEARQRVQRFLASRTVDEQRVEFSDFKERSAYLETYHQIDLCLDTFPYNGGTTTLEAAWMGVPTASLCGQTAVSRGGLTILSHLGLPGLVTSDPKEYVRIAEELAADRNRLSELRSGLRARMQSSPLMDGRAFAGDFESAFRRMWSGWCSSQTPRL